MSLQRPPLQKGENLRKHVMRLGGSEAPSNASAEKPNQKGKRPNEEDVERKTLQKSKHFLLSFASKMQLRRTCTVVKQWDFWDMFTCCRVYQQNDSKNESVVPLVRSRSPPSGKGLAQIARPPHKQSCRKLSGQLLALIRVSNKAIIGKTFGIHALVIFRSTMQIHRSS